MLGWDGITAIAYVHLDVSLLIEDLCEKTFQFFNFSVVAITKEMLVLFWKFI